jgi:hypothetical protein
MFSAGPLYASSRWRRLFGLSLGVMVAAACMGRTSGSAPDAAKDAAASLGPASVLTGHMHATRDGATVDKAMTRKNAAALKLVAGFDANFDGADFGQPLYVDGADSGRDVLFVATNTNVVAALDASTGATLWSKTLGTPVTPAYLPCHQPISQPYGILSTPVIDPGSRTLFTEAFVLGGDAGTTPMHLVFGLSIDDASVRPGWPVDVTAAVNGFFAVSQHQRGSLLLLNGTLYLPFSSCGADCEPPVYHGWVVGISISNPKQVTSWHTTANRGGSGARSRPTGRASSSRLATRTSSAATTSPRPAPGAVVKRSSG